MQTVSDASEWYIIICSMKHINQWRTDDQPHSDVHLLMMFLPGFWISKDDT